MRYKVQGARKETGEIVTVVIEASSESSAQLKANQQGILVERCKQISMAMVIPSMDGVPPLSSPRRPGTERPTVAEVTPPKAVPSMPEAALGISPGTYDVFHDPTIVALLRRQAEPEQLLLICDVFQSHTSPRRMLTLTSTKITILSLDRRPGNLAIGERRDLSLADVHEATTSRAKPLGIGKELVTMKLATRSSIESWSSHFASLERIAVGIMALKAGRTVEPFLRTTEDLAAMRAAEAKAAGREPSKASASSSNAAKQLVRDSVMHLASKGLRGPVARAIGGIVLFVIGFFAVPQILGMLSSAGSPATPSGGGPPSTDRRLSDYTPVPPISVTGNAASMVDFSDWRVDGLKIVGTMRFTGTALFRARATIRNGDTIVDQPSLQMGTVDGAPKGTPVEVSIFIGTRKTDDMRIDIEVLGAH